MTPDSRLASMYAACWESRSREDQREFVRSLIAEMFANGDPEELLARGYIEGSEDEGFRRTKAANADYVMEHWSGFDVSHYLVRPSLASHHHYPDGAVVFPLNLRTEDVMFLNCDDRHFDDLDGAGFGMAVAKVSTNKVVEFFRGKTSAIWFMNLTDPTHVATVVPGDTVFVYDPRNVVFQLNGEIVGAENSLLVESWGPAM